MLNKIIGYLRSLGENIQSWSLKCPQLCWSKDNWDNYLDTLDNSHREKEMEIFESVCSVLLKSSDLHLECGDYFIQNFLSKLCGQKQSSSQVSLTLSHIFDEDTFVTDTWKKIIAVVSHISYVVSLAQFNICSVHQYGFLSFICSDVLVVLRRKQLINMLDMLPSEDSDESTLLSLTMEMDERAPPSQFSENLGVASHLTSATTLSSLQSAKISGIALGKNDRQFSEFWFTYGGGFYSYRKNELQVFHA